MAWQTLGFKSIGELATKLMAKSIAAMERAEAAGLAWRGEPEIYPGGIKPRIDRPNSPVPLGLPEGERLEHERWWYDEWWMRMLPLMLVRDVKRPTRWDELPEIDWLNYAAHHGCHTRLVDWSTSPWVALYFACSRAPLKEGRVWGFDTSSLERVLGQKWDHLGVPVVAGTTVRDIAVGFRPGAQRWIVTQYNQRGPLRMTAQHGLFTFASRLGEAHDALLAEFLPDEAKWQIIIPSSDKPGILGFLRDLGIHHESLQYPMIDQVAGDIAEVYRERLRS